MDDYTVAPSPKDTTARISAEITAARLRGGIDRHVGRTYSHLKEVNVMALSSSEKKVAKRAQMVNAVVKNGQLYLNVPQGELYWSIRRGRVVFMSPEGAVARTRGVKFVYAAIPPIDEDSEDLWEASGPDETYENSALQKAVNDMAEWLGYETPIDYAEGCMIYPDEVRRRLKEAK